jgi:ABC-type nickel/cobalt efflux system permease component RcnA
MRLPITKSVLTATVMAVSLLGNGVAQADGGRYHGDSHDHGHQNQYRKRHHREHRYGGHHDRSYYKGHYGRHVTNYYEYDDDDDDDDEKLLIGIALGGLLGYAINHAVHE